MTRTETPPAPASAAAVAFAELVALTEQVAELIERETSAVEAFDRAGIDAIQLRKQQLTKRYATACAGLRGRMGALDGTTRGRLGRAAARLDAALGRNEKMLRAATYATDRIVAAMVAAVKQQHGVTTRYAPTRGGARIVTAASGVTLDRRL